MTGPKLDLLESGEHAQAAVPGGLSRIDLATIAENAPNDHGQSLRPWAGYVITGNADYVTLQALRARFLARGIRQGRMAYARHFTLLGPSRRTVWRSMR
jgi:hypothetical protein